jgi:GT2 family glycosyltransferase
MKDAGWAVDYVATAAVMHRIGASHGRTSERVVRERHLGMIRYFRKYHSRNPLLVALVSLAVHARMRLMLYLNSRRPA